MNFRWILGEFWVNFRWILGKFMVNFKWILGEFRWILGEFWVNSRCFLGESALLYIFFDFHKLYFEYNSDTLNFKPILILYKSNTFSQLCHFPTFNEIHFSFSPNFNGAPWNISFVPYFCAHKLQILYFKAPLILFSEKQH